MKKLLTGSIVLCLVYLSGLPLSHGEGSGADFTPFSKNSTSENTPVSEEGLTNTAEQTLVAGILEQDYDALVALYNATDGANWTNNTGWLEEGVDAEDWYGISVIDNRVTDISLSSNNLSGAIPEEIGNLGSLAQLNLTSNQLSGTIPAEIGNLSSLRTLSLPHTQLSGAIPEEIGNLSALQNLDLRYNQLSGTIPAQIWNLSDLEALYLGYNQLTGAIPAEIANLSALNHLFLDRNQLSGSIPVEIGNLIGLKSINLSQNQLVGAIPAEIGNLRLYQLNLFGNQLSGAIPAEIGNLKNLSSLYLSDNQLSGAIPAEIGNIDALYSLWLSDNQLSGTIPAEIGNLNNLSILRLSYNQLSGAIPAEIGNLSDLDYLSLEDNQLSGVIPAEIGNLTRLETLRLQNNKLAGSLPPELGNLQNVENLVLDNNPLTGPIPQSLTNLDDLAVNPNHSFTYVGTSLCEPQNQEWLDWKVGRNITGNGIACTPADLYVFRLEGIDANIDLANSTISLDLPGANLGALTAEFEVASGASVSIGSVPQESGTTVNDFSQPLTYTITSADGQQSLDWLVNITSQPIVAGIFEQDYDALVALYNATDGANWTNKTGWLEEGVDAEDWHGISVRENRVSLISLPGNKLSGVIPAEMGDLSALTDLILWENQLTGVIPAEIGDLSSLENLDLGNNQLSGSIPSEIGNLSDLQLLSIYHNQLSGTIPAEIGNLGSLLHLELASNQLSGAIPPEIGNLSDLQYLNFAINQLSGTIPTEIGDLGALRKLWLPANLLTGTIPAEIGSLSDLEYLDLSNNQLVGAIPTEIGDLSDLQMLSFANNQLSGAIPEEVGNLIGLKYLHLAGNQLVGAIPAELGNLSALKVLELSRNSLSGTIPAEIWNLIRLNSLYLQSNHLSGAIPVEIGSLTNLTRLILSGNSLSGSLPSELGNLQNLENLVLDNNPLTGPIPQSLINLDDFAINYDQFSYASTNLCEPQNQEWLDWKVGRNITGNGIVCPPTYPYVFRLEGMDANIDLANSTISLDLLGANLSALVAEFVVASGASVSIGSVPQESGTTVNDFSQPLTYTITSADGQQSLDWLVNITSQPIVAGIFEQDYDALVALYNATDGANWTNKTGWLEEGVDAEDWHGISVRENRVSLISLSSNNLSGMIPEEIGDLNALQGLLLSDNQLSGVIPEEIGNLTSLTQIHLRNNNLTGSLPGDIGALINLQTLWLNGNQLSGTIPAEIGNLASLTQLLLNNNDLTGSLPTEIGALTHLESLWLSDNQLTGTIPVEIGNLTSLTQLLLGSNSLTGSLPNEIGALTNLNVLSLYNNQLSGPIPTEIGNLTGLTQLLLSNNDFTGSLPMEIGALTNLGSLWLQLNQLSGPIPIEIGNLASLTQLILDYNDLTGSLPSELGNLQNLGSLSINNTSLTGPIPQSLINLDYLADEFNYFSYAGTNLCEPQNQQWLDWKAGRNITGNGIICNTEGLLTFSLQGQSSLTINETLGTISIIVEAGTDISNLIASFTLGEGANAYVNELVQVSGTTANNFSQPVTYTVIAEDGFTTQNWEVSVLIVQSITFGELPTKTFDEGAFALTATASSGLTVTYSSSNEQVATINGNMVTIIGVGETTITASQQGSDNYLAATSVAQVLTVNETSQSITFEALPAKTFGDEAFELTATASSGLAVTYSSSNEQVATISGNTVTIIGAGETTITASQQGNDNYLAATSVAQVLTVNEASQSVTFKALPAKTFGDEAFELTATASSGLTVTYSSSNEQVATISGNTVTIIGAGETTITASQQGNDNYLAATSVAQVLTVTKASQSITFEGLPAKTFGDEAFALTATASSDLTVTYSSSNEQVATISGTTVTIIGAGETTITASQQGNDNYLAATPVAQVLTVNKASQSITFEALPAKTFGDEAFALTATASSNLAITYSSSNEQVATISGTTVTIIGAGETTITASQQGNNNYLAATSIVQVLAVNKASQSITFEALPAKTFGDEAFELTATASSSLTVTYSSSNEQVATINGNTVTIIGAGETTITVSQQGNGNYLAATSVAQVLTVNKASQSITFEALPAKTFGEEAFALTASASSGLTVTYSSSNEQVATINGNTVTIIGVGETSITASQQGNDNYLAATSVAQVLTVTKASQSSTFAALPAKTFGDEAFALTATASSGLTVTYSSSNEQVATISGNTVTIVGVGETSITASQQGNDNYLAATPVLQLLKVNKASQSIAFEALPAKTFGDEAFELTATASSGLAVTYSSSNEQVATISGNTVTIIGAGETTITASQQGNGSYLPAQPVAQAFEVIEEKVDTRKDQVITFQLPASLYVDEGPFDLSAQSDSGLPVAYELKTGAASIVNNQLIFDESGEITIIVSQEGNDEFKPAQSVTATITIRPFMSISGKVIAQNGPNLNGIVQAIQKGTESGVKGQTSLIDGNFLFSGLKDGDYLIKFIPNGPSASQYFPTYYTSAFFWQQAQTVTLSNTDVTDIELSTIPKDEAPSQPGIGRIKGKVVAADDAGRSRIVLGRLYEGGSALEGISVYLMKSGEQAIVSEALTDAEGIFEMNGLPGGQYELFLDVPGIAMAPGSSVIDLDETKPIELTAFVGEDGIVTEITVISSVPSEVSLQITVYPNPVSDYLVLDYKGNDVQSKELTVRLYNILGRELMADKVAKGKTLLDLRGYSPGILMLSIFDESRNLVGQIKIKKE